MIHVDPELKKHIIQQHLRDGRTITSLSDEYGYSREVISRWIKEFRKAAFEDVQKSRLLMQWKKPIVFARKLKNFGRKTIS